jgi:hypothetical protein
MGESVFYIFSGYFPLKERDDFGDPMPSFRAL